MDSIDDLKELDGFEQFKSFIKNFIINNSKLWKLIYYSDSNPLILDYNDSPYDIFKPSSEHGCVLFRRKNDIVQSGEQICTLITFHSTPKGNSLTFRDIFIIVRIIAKGTNIQELENGLNRINCIGKLFDDEFNQANITGLGKVNKEKYRDLSLNEENDGMMLMFSASDFSYDYLNNKNIQKQLRGDS
ncbi:MAG: hypothetical protein Q8936_19460 [Bacillota bacterium]|nr:hypothetical protein [Bacillota bacterium]